MEARSSGQSGTDEAVLTNSFTCVRKVVWEGGGMQKPRHKKAVNTASKYGGAIEPVLPKQAYLPRVRCLASSLNS